MKHRYSDNHAVQVLGMAKYVPGTPKMNMVRFGFWVQLQLGYANGYFLGYIWVYFSSFQSSRVPKLLHILWGSTVIYHLKKGIARSDPDLGL